MAKHSVPEVTYGLRNRIKILKKRKIVFQDYLTMPDS
jgi:hypothetical protein